MTFDLINQIPRIGERAEILVTWYLRFNEFFPLPNFILHDGGLNKAPGQQLTEADLLAFRMPFTGEMISTPNGTIHTLIDPRLAIRSETVELLVAEVCSQRCKFNWLCKSPGEQQEFFKYTARRFGVWPDIDITSVAEHLVRDLIWDMGSKRVRVMSFGTQKDSSGTMPTPIEQITLEEIITYLQTLFTCYGQKLNSAGKFIVSDHHQWHPLIGEIYARLLGHKVPRQSPADVSHWLFATDAA